MVYGGGRDTFGGGVMLGSTGWVNLEKISLSCLMAWNWTCPGVLNGALWRGLAMASISAMVARWASSASEDERTAQRWRENSMVMLSCFHRVVEM